MRKQIDFSGDRIRLGAGTYYLPDNFFYDYGDRDIILDCILYELLPATEKEYNHYQSQLYKYLIIMTDEIIIRRLRSTLSTIYLEAKEPIVKAMAESVLRETMPPQPQQLLNEHCKKHFWFGISGESCPICIEQKKNDQSQRK